MMKFFRLHLSRLFALASPALVPPCTLLAGFALCRNRAREGLSLAPITGRRAHKPPELSNALCSCGHGAPDVATQKLSPPSRTPDIVTSTPKRAGA